MPTIVEGSARIRIPKAVGISKKMPVFYNPHMAFNRDISVLLVGVLRPQRMCLPLAASGIRAIRFAKQVPEAVICANDVNPRAVSLMRSNAKMNEVRFDIENRDANELLLSSGGFEYIDLDVFGSPNPFLDASCKRMSRGGILAVTATDTAALAGTYPKACARKYWSRPLRNELMHEIGLRILIRKVQLIGAQYDKALVPVFVHATRHYVRAYMMARPGKSAVDKELARHVSAWWCSCCGLAYSASCGTAQEFGPFYDGPLWDVLLVKKMRALAQGHHEKFFSVIEQEAAIPVVGFFDPPSWCKRKKCTVPPLDSVMMRMRSMGYAASRTHFNPNSIRTTMPLKECLELLSQ
ncbi:tRNA (guanine(10)-N(2))-dimethyltransferase [Candidatus Woesearchaeota archaeon]|nr:tRNA (guanine(10)-N(2))-dimethyltransferase [Candidatus Woesearchaeota archaeon]